MFYKQDEQINCDCGSQDFTRYDEDMNKDEDGKNFVCDLCGESDSEILDYHEYLDELEKLKTEDYYRLNKHL